MTGPSVPPSRLLWLVVLVVLMAVVLGIRFSSRPELAPLRLEVGMSAPEWSLPNADGRLSSSSQWKNQVVLLAFISIQSNPNAATPDASRAQLVALKSLAVQNKTLQVVVIDASQLVTQKNTSQSEQQNFSSDWQLEPILFLQDTPDLSIIKKYTVLELPTTFLMDRNHRVLQRWTGRTLPATLALAVQEALK